MSALENAATGPQPEQPRVLVSLPSMNEEERQQFIANLEAAAGTATLWIATPDDLPQTGPGKQRTNIFSYTPSTPPLYMWVLTAADYRNAAGLLRERNCNAAVVFGDECASLSSDCLRSLIEGALAPSAALCIPRYKLGPHDGLVNAAILHPLTVALYGEQVRFPLPLDVGFNASFADRIHAASERALSRASDSLLWPVAEAAAAGFAVREVECDPRTIPSPPPSQDLNLLLSTVVGSLFADIEAKAAVWQRSRAQIISGAPAAVDLHTATDLHGATEDVHSLVSGFCNAYSNLHDLWTLVLPPQTLLSLKRLSQSPPDTFLMPDQLWVRIVYDFVIAYHLRTLNQTHLLGALTPLYLAWVASHLRTSAENSDFAEAHIAAQTAAFQRDKPYLLARWRWPDRFNP